MFTAESWKMTGMTVYVMSIVMSSTVWGQLCWKTGHLQWTTGNEGQTEDPVQLIWGILQVSRIRQVLPDTSLIIPDHNHRTIDSLHLSSHHHPLNIRQSQTHTPCPVSSQQTLHASYCVLTWLSVYYSDLFDLHLHQSPEPECVSVLPVWTLNKLFHLPLIYHLIFISINCSILLKTVPVIFCPWQKTGPTQTYICLYRIRTHFRTWWTYFEQNYNKHLTPASQIQLRLP